MITLTKDANVYTMIVHFEIEPAHQQEQIDAIVEFVESVVKHQPGFLSATLHKSTDGTRIVNYAQWESKAAWQAAFASPAVRAYSKNPFQYAKPDGHDYEVYHVTDCTEG